LLSIPAKGGSNVTLNESGVPSSRGAINKPFVVTPGSVSTSPCLTSAKKITKK